MKSGEYLLVAIDGTSSTSEEYTGEFDNKRIKSFVRRFHDDFKIPYSDKIFIHGPGSNEDDNPGFFEGIGNTIDAGTGASSDEIMRKAYDWLWDKLTLYPQAKVIIVGHSRGGHIAIELCRRFRELPSNTFTNKFSKFSANVTTFKDRITGRGTFLDPFKRIRGIGNSAREFFRSGIPIHFLGLYDAVDMTRALGNTTTIPDNVTCCFRIQRNPQLGSRNFWGFTGSNSEVNRLNHPTPLLVNSTHGALGGAYPSACKAADPGFGGFIGSAYSRVAGEDVCNFALSAEMNNKNANMANHALRKFFLEHTGANLLRASGDFNLTPQDTMPENLNNAQVLVTH